MEKLKLGGDLVGKGKRPEPGGGESKKAFFFWGGEHEERRNRIKRKGRRQKKRRPLVQRNRPLALEGGGRTATRGG